MKNQDFLDKLDYEGWDYILFDLNPKELKDKKLKKLLIAAQDAAEELRCFVCKIQDKREGLEKPGHR